MILNPTRSMKMVKKMTPSDRGLLLEGEFVSFGFKRLVYWQCFFFQATAKG